MARAKKRAEVQSDTTTLEPDALPPGATDFNPAEFERQAAAVVQQVATATEMPQEESRAPEHNGNGHAPGHIANPSSIRRESHAATVRKQVALPDKLIIRAGDLKVQLIDKGDNGAGIGIRVALPEGRKLNDDEKEVIRTVMNEPNGQYPSGFKYNGVMWHKEIGGNTPGYIASAIRAEAESRVAKLADALKQHQTDPTGYTARIEQERAHAQSSPGLPD